MAKRQRRGLHPPSLNHPARAVTMRRKPGCKTQPKCPGPDELEKCAAVFSPCWVSATPLRLRSEVRRFPPHTRPDRVRCHRLPTSFVASETTVDVQANPARRVLVFLLRQMRVCLSPKKPGSSCQTASFAPVQRLPRFPTQNSTKLTLPARFQAPGVPSGKFRNVFLISAVIRNFLGDRKQTAVAFFAA